MIRVAVLCVLMAGCAGPRVINGNAPVPWHVGAPSDIRAYIASQGYPTAPPPLYYGGVTDHEKPLIWTARSFDTNKDRYAQELGWQINEFCHLTDLVGDHWKAAYLISGGDLDALCTDMPPEKRAMVLALKEARRAAQYGPSQNTR